MCTEITKIQRTKQGRYALFCSAGFLFSVDGETLVKKQVMEGVSLSSAELYALREESDLRKAKYKALTYLSLRDHCFAELQKKLEKYFDVDTAYAATLAMQELELIDDMAFAQHRAKYLIEVQGRSVREATIKMTALGVPREVAAAAMEPYLESGAVNVAALIEKKYLRKLQQGEIEKILAALQRRGYSYADAQKGLSIISDKYQNSNEEFE